MAHRRSLQVSNQPLASRTSAGMMGSAPPVIIARNGVAKLNQSILNLFGLIKKSLGPGAQCGWQRLINQIEGRPLWQGVDRQRIGVDSCKMPLGLLQIHLKQVKRCFPASHSTQPVVCAALILTPSDRSAKSR